MIWSLLLSTGRATSCSSLAPWPGWAGLNGTCGAKEQNQLHLPETGSVPALLGSLRFTETARSEPRWLVARGAQSFTGTCPMQVHTVTPNPTCSSQAGHSGAARLFSLLCSCRNGIRFLHRHIW